MSVKGKGVYIWNTLDLIRDHHGGSAADLAARLKDAAVDTVAIKIINGAYVWKGLEPAFDALRSAGITAGAWGYTYLNGSFGNTAEREANATIAAIERYAPAFYLLDVEGYLRWQFTQAARFAKIINDWNISLPIGLNSYAYPKGQPSYMYPWQAISRCCSFICPQVYWRSGDPIAKLQASRSQYDEVISDLPVTAAAGDMYFEHGVKPTPAEVKTFLEFVRDDPELEGALMWSYDQSFFQKDLWRAFSQVSWKQDEPEPQPTTPQQQAIQRLEQIQAGTVDCQQGVAEVTNLLKAAPDPDLTDPVPIYAGVVVTKYGAKLNVRSKPSTVTGKVVKQLDQGARVNVWKEKQSEGRLWLRIDEKEKLWVASSYVEKI